MIQVNPNTVQRAYREMEQANITQTLRGQGTFICDDPDLVTTIRKEMAERALVAFVEEMRALGYGREQVSQMVDAAYRRVVEGGSEDGHSHL